MKTIKKIKTTKKKPTLEKKKKTTLKPTIKKQSLKKTAPKKTIATKKAIKKPNTKITTKHGADFAETTKTKNTVSTKPKIRAGEVASINTKRASGHKGSIAKVKKTGEISAFTLTHSKYTHGRKNIPLVVNPQKNDKRKAYVVKKPHKVAEKHIGKHHPNVRIKNSTDKSIMRKLRTTAKKNNKKKSG